MAPTVSEPQAPTTVAASSMPDAVRRWTVLGVLCLIYIVAYFDRLNLSVALAVPEFKAYFGLTDLDRGTLNSAFFWTYAALQIPAGLVVDRFGARRTLAVGFVLWSLVAAGSGLAQSFVQLFVFRLLLGVGESVVTPAGMRWIRFNCPEERRGLAIGFFMAAAKIGPALGNFLAGWLLLLFGWRPMFVVLGLGSLVCVVPWWLLARDDAGRLPPQPASVATAPVPAVSLRAILRSPALWGILIGTFAYQYFNYYCMTWMQAYLVERRNLTLSQMSLFAGFTYAGFAAVAIISGWWADRLIRGGRDPVNVRRAFSIAGLFLASSQILGAFTESAGWALFFAIFSLSALGLTTPNYWALTQTLLPGTAIGRIVGIQNCAANIPGIAAPVLTGWLKQTTGSYEAPMVAVTVFLWIGVASYLVLVRARWAPRAHPAGVPAPDG